MKYLPVTIFLTLLNLTTFAAEVASLNFDAIKDDFREYYFSKPENAAIQKQFDAAVQEENRFQEDLQKQFMEGGQSINWKSMASEAGGMGRFQLERKIDSDLKKELYLIVK